MSAQTGLFKAVTPISPVRSNYTRPIDWLPLPYPAEGTQALYALVAVFDGISNRMAFSAAGAYTVDWGDGSAAEDIATGVTAEHEYTYSSLPSTSYCDRGYRQAVISVTPQAGQNLTAFDFQKKHTNGITGYESRNILDVNIRAPNLATLAVSTTTATRYGMALMERFWMYGTYSSISLQYLFHACRGLLSFSIPSNSSNYAYMFTSTSVRNISMSFSVNADLTSVLSGAAFVRIADINITSISVLTDALAGMSSLQKATITAPSCTNVTRLCSGNRYMKSLVGDLSGATTTTDMVKDCSSLETFLVTGMKTSFNLATTNLNAAAFAAAGALVADGTGQTVTISAALDGTLSAGQRAVWTDKNWTVAAV